EWVHVQLHQQKGMISLSPPTICNSARKSINGLSLLVEQEMQLSPFSGALFVFCNQQRTRLKVLYWDSTGFCLWYKRLEKDKFRWPRQMPGKILSISEQQWHWLLQGVDIQKITAHQPLHYQSVG
ncbi:IS66 family insertion sequence element accessory protein TnpB, partial [Acinetobacter baumannii]|nr:IS66 family insertion sequence element accessory protein TnpB [Acinetobacter baumannii]MCF4789214.1 IS66 family insertion sequence element accessory protein TnpB [Acinetobacter baumannii]MCF4792656.1 IS66 family insertion sequence element accessory protein TnpB [Acinetobacter baumannii]MCF4796174.1 IS66 family insertion sequence element accessory protein TnpB [Acinetobacter baumannii]MCF4814988.1 IS66 family insertion sequence element accessory protein TnpB [Acinetobacter baumannii]